MGRKASGRRATDRDRRRWPYAHALYRDDELLIETVHGTQASFMIEVQASEARVRRGDATRWWVDGVTEETVQRWLAEATW
jgi:hypothetical protein